MPFVMSFKDSKTGVRYVQNDGRKTAELYIVKQFLKAYSGRNWFQRRTHIRELQRIGATGIVHKRPREGRCNFFIIFLP